MKRLAATLAIAAGLVVAAPAEAHQFKGWYHNQFPNPGAKVDDREAYGVALSVMWRTHGSWPSYMRAHDWVNNSAVWVIYMAGPQMHSLLVDHDVGGAEPGWTVTGYEGWRP